MSEDNNRATIVVFSGDMDKVFAALIIAIGCAAAGMDTTLFFTFWGLNAIKTGAPIKARGFLGKMMGILNRGGVDRLNPSRFSFGGIGRVLFSKMMRDKKVASLEELRQTLIDLDVHLLACKMSMDVLEITREDLIPEVEDVVGVATFVKEAAKSRIQLFI
ncbi:MAG: DsrE/DsrF/DrsH-like family protein [Chloroflexi bacterium]|jgi:peroxiredoxin family protein|nr:DsrE/DsrF/DrsH-like family protein [Chloroflexota bacterium]